MVNFDTLTAEIGSAVWGTQTNFNWFRVLASLLQRRRSPEANQTLHDVWPSPTLVLSLSIFSGLLPPEKPLAEFCQVQNSLYVQVLPSPILAALLHGTPAAGVSPTLRRGTMEWNYGTFAKGATYIRLGGHHVGIVPHCSYICHPVSKLTTTAVKSLKEQVVKEF